MVRSWLLQYALTKFIIKPVLLTPSYEAHDIIQLRIFLALINYTLKIIRVGCHRNYYATEHFVNFREQLPPILDIATTRAGRR